MRAQPKYSKEEFAAMEPHKHVIVDSGNRTWIVLMKYSQGDEPPSFLMRCTGQRAQRITLDDQKGLIDDDGLPILELNHHTARIKEVED
ncbi:hypothetical protein ACFL04_00960 [Patescibacteria group bacterium]